MKLGERVALASGASRGSKSESGEVSGGATLVSVLTEGLAVKSGGTGAGPYLVIAISEIIRGRPSGKSRKVIVTASLVRNGHPLPARKGTSGARQVSGRSRSTGTLCGALATGVAGGLLGAASRLT